MTMDAKRFNLFCMLTVFMQVTLGDIPKFDCNQGSLNISLLEDDYGIISIDCDSPLFALQSINATSDDSCEALQNLKIVPKTDWLVSEVGTKVEDYTSPADYIVIDMLTHLYPVGGDYRQKLQNLQIDHKNKYGSLLYNFIITDDGAIYEGLGWDKKNDLFSGGLDSVRIRFVTKESDVAPDPAIKAFNSLVKAGTCRGSIAQNYMLIPNSYIRDYIPSALFNKEFELLNQLENLETDKNFDNVCGISPPTSVTYREEWGIKLDRSKFLQYDSAIDIVIVRDFNARCFTVKNCHSTLDYHRDRGKLEGINFFIGEDGQIYEYLGWEFTEEERFRSRGAIIVAFLGTYSNYVPSRRAFSTFNNFLRYGVKWGYLSKYYIISSYRSVKNDESFVGSSLHSELKKFATFTDNL